MVIEVNKQEVKIKEPLAINEGECGVNKCKFILPECFEGLCATAVFNNIPVPIVNGECVIPSLKKGNAVAGVYAYLEGESGIKIMYSPKPTVFYVSEGSYSDVVNEEAFPDISLYEEYCRSILNKYEAVEGALKQSEKKRNEAEKIRENTFLSNENIRNSMVGNSYTNLLDSAAKDSATENPTQLPAHKVDVLYQQLGASEFVTKNGYECYIFEAQQGERFNMSNFSISSAANEIASIAIVDSNFGVIDNFNTALKATSFACGLYACPENTAYVIINKAMDGNVPVVTRVDEPVFETLGGFIPGGTKCVSALNNSTNHATYYGNVGSSLTNAWRAGSVSYYSDGIYPLEKGKEYVLCVPESIAYNIWGLVCNESLIVNKQITDESFDKNRRYVFTATSEDKYIALNCCDFNTIQFGENKCNKIKAGACIGSAFFDGKNDVSLKEIGVIDRSLADKKWISYGDSITRGVGVDFVNGEKRWQDYIVERYNIGTHIEMGEGYTSLGHKNGEVGACYCHDSRLNALINESPDIVTILGGANDYIFNIPIGTDEDIESKNIETFKGAYAYIIERILSSKSDTIIVLLGMFHNAMGAYGEGKGIYSLKEYSVATKDIAKYFGLPFVDLNECGFNKYNFNDTNGIFSTDGIHPNKEGAKRMAMVVSRWFDSFNGTAFSGGGHGG